MSTAFQPTSFQNNAFQVGGTVPSPSYVYVVKIGLQGHGFQVDPDKRLILVEGDSRDFRPDPDARGIQVSAFPREIAI